MSDQLNSPYNGTPGPRPPSSLDVIQGLLHQQSQQQRQLTELLHQLNQSGGLGGPSSPMPGATWPRQQKMGVVLYPEMSAYPYTWGYTPVREGGNANAAAYATTGARCRANIEISDIYSFICGVQFRLRRITAPEDPAFLPVGCWLPLGAKYHPFVATGDEYIGKDFTFSVESSAAGINWQGLGAVDRASNDCDVNGVFWFSTEYQAKTRDVFTIQATPLQAPRDGETFVLETALVGYQMRNDPK